MSTQLQKFKSNYMSPHHMRYSYYIDPKGRFVYAKNHKAGCTTVLSSLYEHLAHEKGRKFEPRSTEAVHKSRHGLIPSRGHLREPKFASVINNPKFFRFTFMREPISRVVSAFVDKIHNGNPERAQLLKAMGYDQDFQITLHEFVQVLNAEPALIDLNPHWRPQVKEISYGVMNFDYIGLLSNMDEELPIVLKYLFPDQDGQVFDARERLKHRTKSAKFVEKLSAEDRNILETLYAEDIAAYSEVLANPYPLPVRES